MKTKIYNFGSSFIEVGDNYIKITAIEPIYNLDGEVVDRKVAVISIPTNDIEFFEMIGDICSNLLKSTKITGEPKKMVEGVKKSIDEWKLATKEKIEK